MTPWVVPGVHITTSGVFIRSTSAAFKLNQQDYPNTTWLLPIHYITYYYSMLLTDVEVVHRNQYLFLQSSWYAYNPSWPVLQLHHSEPTRAKNTQHTHKPELFLFGFRGSFVPSLTSKSTTLGINVVNEGNWSVPIKQSGSAGRRMWRSLVSLAYTKLHSNRTINQITLSTR